MMQLDVNAESSQDHKSKKAQTVLTLRRCLGIKLIRSTDKATHRFDMLMKG